MEERLAALTAGERRVAYFYEAPDTSTFRYRVFNMVEALNSTSGHGTSAAWFCHEDLKRTSRFIDDADALVLCRTRYNAAVAGLIARARARRIPILFDVDDLVFDCAYIHSILDTLDQNTESERDWDWWFSYAARLGATLRLCDAVITTNQYLADRIRDFASGVSARIIPNFLNRVQQIASDRIWAAKVDTSFARDGKIHIGYFSGTPTHNLDFQIAASALSRLLQTDSRIVVRIVGFSGSKTTMLGQTDRVELIPLQDFLNLQRLIGQVEINLAPVQNTVFSNCKSELKYFEAAIVGTLTIASPTFTFRDAIDADRTGLLASADEWEAKLRTAVEIAEDPSRYALMTESAHRHAEQLYGWNAQADKIQSAIFSD
jgi:glycosyltransferase involved in cell wall biosynthesis